MRSGQPARCWLPAAALMLAAAANPAHAQSLFAERTAVKRWGQTIDMVGPVLLLATDAGAFVTGNVILADGGMLCRTFD